MPSIIITGASSGIGKALALEYAKRGFDLGLTARRTNILETLKRDIEQNNKVKVQIAPLDVKDYPAVSSTIEGLSKELGGVGVVVANSGITGIRATGKGKFEMDVDIINTNLIGGMATIDAAAKVFRQLGRGHIVGISSFMAFRGIPGTGAYAASKAALSTYLESARVELMSKKISTSNLYVGFVKTELMENIDKYPFLIPSDKAAKLIADAIEKRVVEDVIPAFPWKGIRPIVNVIPDAVWKRMF